MTSIANSSNATKKEIIALRGALVDSTIDGNTDVEIQAAIDALSGGRTSKEKVIITGTFVLAATITIPSYTILDLSAAKISSTHAGTSFTNSDTVAGNTDIEILGGDIDGSRSVKTSGHGIYLKNVTNGLVSGCKIYNTYAHCVDIVECFHTTVQYGDFSDSGDDGISVLGDTATENSCRFIKVLYNRVYNTEGSAGGSSGIEIEDGARDVLIHGNTVHDCVDVNGIGNGIHIVQDAVAGTPFGMRDIIVTENHCYNNEGTGIDASCNDADTSFKNIIITNNVCTNNGTIGIGLIRAHNSIVSNNICRSNALNNIKISHSNNPIISDNISELSGTIGIELFTVNDANIHHNKIMNCGQTSTDRFFKINTGVNIRVHDNDIVDDQGVSSTNVGQLFNVTGDISIKNNHTQGLTATPSFAGGGTTDFSVTTSIDGNNEFPVVSSGEFTILSGVNFSDITHNLGFTLNSEQIIITPKARMQGASDVTWWINEATSTNSAARLETAPVLTADCTFGWKLNLS